MLKQHYTPFERVLRVVMHLVLIIVTISCAYPFWYVLIYALSDSKAALNHPVILWPVAPTLAIFRQLLNLKMLWSSFFNSVFVTLVGTVLAVTLTSSLAYPLSVRRLRGRGIIAMFLYFTMLFSGGMIPAYLLIRDLHLMDSRWALVLPGLLSVYNLLVLRNFFLGIPGELEESASIDGASPLRVLVQIILPLSLPALAVQAMLYGVGYWNSYMGSVMYINSPSKISLQAYLRTLLNTQTASSANVTDAATNYTSDASMRMGCVAITLIPMLIVYPWIQKYYVGGLTIGAVKG